VAVDLEDEGCSAGMLRGIFDQDQSLPYPGPEDVLARSEIALAELVRWLRRVEDREMATAGRACWNAAFARGYAEGRSSAALYRQAKGPTLASQVAPARTGLVCALCRDAVAEEVSGFDLDRQHAQGVLGDETMLSCLARELGADISGHRCEARDGLGTCACGCAVWREHTGVLARR
jgi:hypothetical protein